MFCWQTHRQRPRERRDFRWVAAVIGIAPFLAGSTSPIAAQQDVWQSVVQGHSAGQQNGTPATGGWTVEDHPSIGMRGSSASTPPSVVWTSPGGGPDNLLPVIGPRLELPGHLKMAWKVAVSPDSKLLASSDSAGRRIRLWSMDEGRLVAAYEPHTAMILSLAFSPDGRFLASASDDKSVCLREITADDYREVRLPHPYEVQDLAFSSDGKWLATVCMDYDTQRGDGPSRVTLWDLRTRRSFWQDSGDVPDTVSFSPDNKTVAVGGHQVTLWDVARGVKRVLLDGNYGWRACRGFSPDGETLLITDAGLVRLLNVADGSIARTFAGRYFGNRDGVSAAFAPDGKTIATRHFGGVQPLVLWDVASGVPKTAFVPMDYQGMGLAFAPHGKSIAAGVADRVFVWDVPSSETPTSPTLPDLKIALPERLARPQATLKGAYGGGITSLAFSADGRNLAAGTYNGPIQVWDVASRGLTKELLGHQVRIDSVAFSADGRTLASGGQETTDGLSKEPIRIWEWEHGRTVRELAGNEHLARIKSLRFASDGKSLLSLGSGPAWDLWDLATGVPKRLNPDMEGASRVVAASPAGDRIAIDRGNRLSVTPGAVEVWDTVTGRRIFATWRQEAPVASLVYSPDGRTLAVGLGDPQWHLGTVKLLQAATGETVSTLDGHEGPVYAIAFSPDGKLLVSGSGDRTIKIWDPSTGDLRATLPAHRGAVTCLTFSPDGKQLASGSLDDSIRLWQTSRLTAERSD